MTSTEITQADCRAFAKKFEEWTGTLSDKERALLHAMISGTQSSEDLSEEELSQVSGGRMAFANNFRGRNNFGADYFGSALRRGGVKYW